MKDNITFTFDYEKDKTEGQPPIPSSVPPVIESEPKINLWLLGLIFLGIIIIKK